MTVIAAASIRPAIWAMNTATVTMPAAAMMIGTAAAHRVHPRPLATRW